MGTILKTGDTDIKEGHDNAHEQHPQNAQVHEHRHHPRVHRPFFINTLYYNIALNQYEGIIENVYSANSLSSRLKGEIYTTMWNVVTGKTAFRENTQYELIDRIRTNLDQLEENANSADNEYLVQVARNTLETMEGYVDKIGDNIAHDRPVRENEKILG